jgi:hypothetical protein
MPENFVTVATYTLPYEAELARNLLGAEGIAAFVSGDLSGGLLPTGEIRLQVAAEDAQRATAVLASQAAATLDSDWEEKAESDAGVWTCSLCGAPVSTQRTGCDSCQTPRDAIRADPPRPFGDIQRGAPPPPGREGIHSREHVATAPASAPPPAPPPVARDEGDEDSAPAEAPTAEGDEFARRAFLASVFSLLFTPLLLLSGWYLLRLMAYSGEVSAAGMKYLYGALALCGLIAFVWGGFFLAWVVF